MSSSPKKSKSTPKRRKRRKFTPEFRADVVRLCQSGTESIGAVCRRLELTESAVRHWVKQAETDTATASAALPSEVLSARERAELQQLRRDVKRLTMEREILTKAAAFFAKENA